MYENYNSYSYTNKDAKIKDYMEIMNKECAFEDFMGIMVDHVRHKLRTTEGKINYQDYLTKKFGEIDDEQDFDDIDMHDITQRSKHIE